MTRVEPEVIAEARYLRMVRRGSWEYVERSDISGIVAIVALTANRELLLIEQYRPPVDLRVIELPAGLAGDLPGDAEESLEAAAHRELLEETGYQAEDMIRLFHSPPSPGMTSEVLTFFLARDVEKVAAGGGDESEDITAYAVPLDEVGDWLVSQTQQGKLVDLKVYAGLYALRADLLAP